MLFTPHAFLAALTDTGATTDCLPHGRVVRRADATPLVPAEPAIVPAPAAQAAAWRPRNMHEWLT